MHEMIKERQGSEKKEERFDLLSGFLDEDDEQGVKLLESDFIGTNLSDYHFPKLQLNIYHQGIFSFSSLRVMRFLCFISNR